jgi:hypothetical protein
MSNPESFNPDDMAQRGLFVSVHISKPTLRTKLRWKDLGLPELEGVVSPPSTRPPSKEFAVFERLESRMRTLLRKYSAGSEHGFRYMKFDSYADFIKDVEPLREAFREQVPVFLAAWEDNVAAAVEEWRGKAKSIYAKLDTNTVTEKEFVRNLLSRLRSSWPDAERLAYKFDTSISVLQFAIPDASQGLAADSALFDDSVIADARERARETMNSFFAEAQDNLRLQAVEIVRRIHGVLTRGDTITDRSINPLRDFVDQFRQLSVVPDSEFQSRLDGVMNLIDNHGGAEGLRNSTDAWVEVRDMMDEVAQAGEQLAAEAISKKMDLSDRKIQL